jgi:hypothetical protein
VKITLIEILTLAVVILVIAIPVTMGMGMWDRPSDSTEALRKSGFSEIEIGDHAFFRCGRSDVSSLYFTANNPRGDKVDGTVCCGWFKSCTVRF